MVSELSYADALTIGASIGILSQLVREQGDKKVEREQDHNRPDFTITRLARASAEGAAQLVTYEAARDYVKFLSPYFNPAMLAEALGGPLAGSAVVESLPLGVNFTPF